MSWQTYIDDHLLVTKMVTDAGIYGLDGAVWATSPGLKATADEVKKIVSGFADEGRLAAEGIHIGGEKYMFVKALDGKEIIGKKGAYGMVAFKGNTFVMLSVHDDSIQAQACSAATGKLADYLIEQGL